MEQLLLPLMHFLLLGFLPLDGMRLSTHPFFGAGCGQIFVADRDAYWKAGGHEAIRESRHDGLTLPRAFRSAGFKTDLCDATYLASCRTYRSDREVVSELLKNATEGLASPKSHCAFHAALIAGQVLPLLLVSLWSKHAWGVLLLLTAVAASASYLPRIVAVFRFKTAANCRLTAPRRNYGFVAFNGWHCFEPSLGCRLIGKDELILHRSPRFMLQSSLVASDNAPDFELLTAAGKCVHLYEDLQRSPIVLFFYVKAFTPVCTAEVCVFRNHALDFQDADCAIFGVTSDTPTVAQRFARSHRLPFPILLDLDNRVRKLYGVPKLLGILPGRATSAIGRDHLVRQVICTPFRGTEHVMKSLQALQEAS